MSGSQSTGFEVAVMTDDQRRAVAYEYLLRMDRGDNFLELFDDNARVFFPKWGVAKGRAEFERLFSDLMSILKSVEHHSDYFNTVVQGDTVILEGTTSGVTAKGIEWRGGVTHAGRWCDVFEIRDFRIQRLFIFLDPDYGDEDTARYPWLAGR